MDLKYLDEVWEANTPHVCKPPGWWRRMQWGISRNGTWVCPRCNTLWKWRYWDYSDMCVWEKVGHVEHQCQYRTALEELVKEPEDLMAMKVDAVRERLGL